MRTTFALRNIFVGLGGFFITTIMSFIVRIVFIKTLGLEYLGLQGLFTNVLTILSVAELGIGTSILYSLYKPTAQNDVKKVQALMNLYKKIYTFLGFFLLVLGLLLLPFIHLLIQDITISNIHLIYLLFLFNSVITYFYAYKRSIINADQKNYIIVIIKNLSNFIFSIIQIILLWLTKSFILVLIIQIINTLVQNLIISRKANKMFPYLKKKNSEKVSEESLSEIIKNIKGVIFYRIGTAITNGTDNIIISSFIGIKVVGIYSNYLLIINSITNLLNQVFNSLTASIGNLAALESKDKQYFIFNVLFLIHFWIYGFIFIALVMLLNPFIILWLGNEYTLQQDVIFMIALNFYLWGIQGATNNFRVALGLFWYGRYRPIIASIVNLIASIYLVQHFGLIGVFIGTTISIVSITIWFDPIVVHKYGFHSPSKKYFLKYIKYNFILLLAFVATFIAMNVINSSGLFTFLIKVIICISVINIIFYLFLKNTREFKYLLEIILVKILRRKK